MSSHPKLASAKHPSPPPPMEKPWRTKAMKIHKYTELPRNFFGKKQTVKQSPEDFWPNFHQKGRKRLEAKLALTEPKQYEAGGQEQAQRQTSWESASSLQSNVPNPQTGGLGFRTERVEAWAKARTLRRSRQQRTAAEGEGGLAGAEVAGAVAVEDWDALAPPCALRKQATPLLVNGSAYV